MTAILSELRMVLSRCAIVSVVRNHPDLLDEFTIKPLLVALRGSDVPPWDVVTELTGELLRLHGVRRRSPRLLPRVSRRTPRPPARSRRTVRLCDVKAVPPRPRIASFLQLEQGGPPSSPSLAAQPDTEENTSPH